MVPCIYDRCYLKYCNALCKFDFHFCPMIQNDSRLHDVQFFICPFLSQMYCPDCIGLETEECMSTKHQINSSMRIPHAISFRKYDVPISVLTASTPCNENLFPPAHFSPIRVEYKHFKGPWDIRSCALLYWAFPIYCYLLHLLFSFQP